MACNKCDKQKATLETYKAEICLSCGYGRITTEVGGTPIDMAQATARMSGTAKPQN